MSKIFALACCLSISSLAFGQKISAPTVPSTNPTGRASYEKVSLQLPANADDASVQSALMELKPSIRALGCGLQLRERITSPGGLHYQFAQTWQGIPIHEATVKATLTHGMRFMNTLSSLVTFSGTPAAHQRTDAQVAAALPSLLDEGHPDFHIVENQRQYFLQDGLLLPCHRVVYTANTMSWELLLSDDDLHALYRRDLAAYRKPGGITTTDTTGNALVFNPDPLTTSGHTYGAPYSDANDADTPELNAQRQAVTLKGLTWDGTQFILTGPYVEVADRESPTGAPATSTTGNFFFTRNQQGFEDVMVYYHLDTMQRYIQRLGFLNLQNGPLKADPHGVNSQDNSHFVPAGTDTRLGFGEGGVDDAEDADVIIHEYGHALSYAGSPGSNSGVERQGLDEGYGDYFAASYSRRISYTFWKNTFTWDGHNEFWPGRSASNPTMYPPGGTDIYLYGEIWASVLMEVWPQIGGENCDKVVLQSLYNLNSSMLLSDAALVVLDADSLLNNGAYHRQFQEAFCNRGLLIGVNVGEPCYVGVDNGPSAASFDWALFPNPSNGDVTLAVQDSRGATKLTYRVTDLLGRELLTGDLAGDVAVLPTETLAPAIYLVQLQGSNGRSETKRLIIE